MDVHGKHVLVVGLARSGLAVAHALARHGAVVTVTDCKPPAEFREVVPQLVKEKIGLELGSQRVETFLRHEVIVISPGVHWDLPQLQAARERGVPVYPEVEAASWFLEGTLVGITGSNGKTTTTALLGNMLKASGFPTFVGGNIGHALSSAVGQARPGTRFATELSSFQLEGIRELHPHVAVMLNFSPNHLDRHANLEAYAQAKRQIFRNQGAQDFAVLNADDPWVAGLQSAVRSRPVLFSRHRELPNGVFVSGGTVYFRTRHLERVLFETRDVRLRGDFNLEDVLAAATAGCVLGADFAAIRKAVRAFEALEHRLEFVREIQGVDFYNNSKATSVDATLKSVEAFERGVHLILGGKDKGAPYAPLIPLFKERVREVLLIGAAAPVIAGQLAGATELVPAGDLATAVREAFIRSRPGDTVLLAPACSSFDQFKDYEERGQVFKELVKQLAKDVAKGVVARTRLPEAGAQESGVTSQESAAEPSPSPFLAKAGSYDVRTPLLVKEGCPEGGEAVFRPGGEVAEAQAETPPSPAVVSEPKPLISTVEAAVEKPRQPEAEAKSESSAEASEPSRREEQASPPTPEEQGSLPPRTAAPHPIELNYVYEVDAADMPELESQVLLEEEPETSISTSKAEVPDDEALPYEVRPAVSNRKSEVAGRSDAPPTPRQPRLPGVGE